MTFPVQNLIVQKKSSKKHKVGPLDAPVALFNPDGSSFAATVAEATTGAAGTVKKAAAVADLASDADAATIVTTVNGLLAGLRDAGVIASS